MGAQPCADATCLACEDGRLAGYLEESTMRGETQQSITTAAFETMEALRSAEIQRQLKALGSRDLQLWSIGALIIIVLAVGFGAVVVPNLTWQSHGAVVQMQSRYLPQLFSGLISLIVVFNIYTVMQKRTLNVTRAALIRELVFSERLESFTLVDPLTQLPNRRSLDETISREGSRSTRLGSSLTFVVIKANGIGEIQRRLGQVAADQFLVDTAQLLKVTFRGADVVFRYGSEKFLVTMPDTNEAQAAIALQRLCGEVDQWNLNTNSGCEMSLSFGVMRYQTGDSQAAVLERAEQSMGRSDFKPATPVDSPVLEV